MKTIKQWLEELPEPYRTQALENYERKQMSHSLSLALASAFHWHYTPEGWNYWFELGLKIEENNLLNKE